MEKIIDILLIAGILYSVYTDIKTRNIKNFITFPMMLIGLIYNLTTGGLQGLTFSLKGLLLAGLFSLILFLVNGFGMGDVKLLMGIGAITGTKFSLSVLIISFFSSIIISLLLHPKQTIQAVKNVYMIIKFKLIYKVPYKVNEKTSALTLAYAVHIFIGTVVTYIIGGEFIWVKFLIK